MIAAKRLRTRRGRAGPRGAERLWNLDRRDDIGPVLILAVIGARMGLVEDEAHADHHEEHRRHGDLASHCHVAQPVEPAGPDVLRECGLLDGIDPAVPRNGGNGRVERRTDGVGRLGGSGKLEALRERAPALDPVQRIATRLAPFEMPADRSGAKLVEFAVREVHQRRLVARRVHGYPSALA
jgi:hypothetical protein